MYFGAAGARLCLLDRNYPLLRYRYLGVRDPMYHGEAIPSLRRIVVLRMLDSGWTMAVSSISLSRFHGDQAFPITHQAHRHTWYHLNENHGLDSVSNQKVFGERKWQTDLSILGVLEW